MRGARNGTEAKVGSDARAVLRPAGRRRRVVLAVAALVALPAHEAAAREPMPDASFQQWSGWRQSRTLDDGSVLSEYVTRTDSPDEPDITLSIGFVPRFDCTPLLGIRVVGDLSADVGEALVDGDRVTFAIDGERAELALLVDDDGRATTLWFDAALDERERMRRLIDGGSSAVLGLSADDTLSFSLLGSRQSTAAVEVACRTHEPLPYGDGR